ncbi:hypothetical protein PUW79_11880 [Microbacterium sp. NE2HP2]|uniref:hypothetical protein n=1 Tax=Microbacterium TaxID=33882 RepID=UPI0023662705|nr:hypothetical protein [Microbacterium plantarum]MDD7945332.1 hypothetical protein [Microbacterium plantarum]
MSYTTTTNAGRRHVSAPKPITRTQASVHSGIAAALALATVALYYLLAASFFAEENMPGAPTAQPWACVGALLLTATVLILAYRPIVEGVGRILAISAGIIAALSPLIGYLIHTWT